MACLEITPPPLQNYKKSVRKAKEDRCSGSCGRARHGASDTRHINSSCKRGVENPQPGEPPATWKISSDAKSFLTRLRDKHIKTPKQINIVEYPCKNDRRISQISRTKAKVQPPLVPPLMRYHTVRALNMRDSSAGCSTSCSTSTPPLYRTSRTPRYRKAKPTCRCLLAVDSSTSRACRIAVLKNPDQNAC